MSRLRINLKKFKEYHQNRLDEKNRIVKEKLQEEQRELKEKNKKEELTIIFESNKSNWRKENLREFGEWAPIEGSGPTNSTSTTFGYFVGGEQQVNYVTGKPITFTYSGLNGIENYPTSITIDQGFGEVHTTDAPPFSAIGVQGYTAKLNPKYKAAQEKYKKEIEEWKRKEKQQESDIEATLKSFGTSWKEVRKGGGITKVGNSYVAIINTDSTDFGSDLNNNVRVVRLVPCDASQPMILQKRVMVNGSMAAWNLTNAQYSDDVYLEIGKQPKEPIESQYLMPRRINFKDINPQLDASQEFAQKVDADYMMNARVQDAPPTPAYYPTDQSTVPGAVWIDNPMSASGGYWDYDSSKMGREVAQIANNTSMLPTFNGVPRYNPLANLQIPDGFPFSDAIANTLRYTTGNYDPKVPVKGGQSAALELSMLNTMSNAINSGTLSRDPGRPGFFKVGVRYDGIPKPNSPEGTEFARNDWEGDGSIGNNYATNMSAQGLLQIYSFKPTKNGILVKDRFNLDGSRNAGAVRAIPGAQQVVDFLVNMGDDKIRQRGGNPKDDATAGFDLEYEIPWERVPNNHPLRGNMKESTTWSRSKKHR